MASLAELEAYANSVATQYGIPTDIFHAQIMGENSFQVTGTSSAGAQGIAQFMAPTAKQYGVDVTDPFSSLRGAAAYDADLYKQGGTYTGMLSGYLSGNPNQGVISSVYKANPSYAQAYDLAAQYDAGGVQATPGATTGQDSFSFIDPSTTPSVGQDYSGGGDYSTAGVGLDNQLGGAGDILAGGFGLQAGANTLAAATGGATGASSNASGAAWWNWAATIAFDLFERGGLIILGILLILAAAWALAREAPRASEA
jgi:hypothetical protein